jgi:FMN phosphatase YigB (HAD superfamily)
MYAVSQSHWLPEEEAVSTLESIQSRGIRMGLISNAGDDTDVQVLVDKARLRPFFEIVLSSAACGIRKPNPQIFHLALEQMNASPQEAYMVGDTLRADVLGASNANIFSIWITRRADNPANRSHTDNIVPDATIEGLAELPPLLDKII